MSVFIRKSWVPGKGFVAANKMTGVERLVLRGTLSSRAKERARNRITGFPNPPSMQYNHDTYKKNAALKNTLQQAANTMRGAAKPVRGDANTRVFDSDTNGLKGVPITMALGRRERVMGVSAFSQKKDNRAIAHEMEHVRPKKRTAYRMAQITQDPAKLGREEARADYMSGSANVMRKKGRNTFYSRAAQGDRSAQEALRSMNPNMDSTFARSYRELQEKLHSKGVKEGSRFKTNNRYAAKRFGVQDRPDTFLEKLKDKRSRVNP